MTLRFLSIEHVRQEGPGSIGMYIQGRGASLVRCRQYQHPHFPASHDEYDVLMVMGGPMGVDDTEQYSWMSHELHFIREAITQGKRVLGICLGAQMIAKVLGAEVRKNSCKEIGWFPICFEDAFVRTAVGHKVKRQMDVLHWHGDAFAIPQGAIRIAGSEACANQGFLYEKHVLAFQFHLEMGEQEVSVMMEHFSGQLSPERFVQGAGEIWTRTAEGSELARQALFSILDGWLG